MHKYINILIVNRLSGTIIQQKYLQDRMGELESRLGDAEKERDCLQRQMAASLPQVRFDLFLFSFHRTIVNAIIIIHYRN